MRINFPSFSSSERQGHPTTTTVAEELSVSRAQRAMRLRTSTTPPDAKVKGLTPKVKTPKQFSAERNAKYSPVCLAHRMPDTIRFPFEESDSRLEARPRRTARLLMAMLEHIE
jgi:hypothetical protein